MQNFILISDETRLRLIETLQKLSAIEESAIESLENTVDTKELGLNNKETKHLINLLEACDLHRAMRDRRDSLDDYLNSKEIQRINCYIEDFDAGIANMISMQAFLDVVPAGKYDGDRRRWHQSTATREAELYALLDASSDSA